MRILIKETINFYLFFQKYAVKIINTVKSSNLPTIIKKEAHHLAIDDIWLNVPIGPKSPIEGPTLPKLDADTPKADWKSKPNIENPSAPIIKVSM